MSNEAAHAFMPLLVHALVSGVIRPSDRHPTFGYSSRYKTLAIRWPLLGLRGQELGHGIIS